MTPSPKADRVDPTAKISPFPPLLVLGAAEAHGLVDVFDAGHVASPACAQVHAAWPSQVTRVQAALKAPSRGAFMAQAQALQAELAAVQAVCPSWQLPAQVQSMLLREQQGLYASTHAADTAVQEPLPAQVPHTLEELQAAYTAINAAAWIDASTQVTRSWRAWRAQASGSDATLRRQRYLINLSTDTALVPDARQPADPLYSALARVTVLSQVSARLAVLQGQGPVTTDDVAAYLAASIAHARAAGAHTVVFVNAAAPQVPNFADAVALAAAGAKGLTLHHANLADWQDGSLVTPAGAAQFARRRVDTLEAAGGRCLLVTNCNAGLDRSGTLNALAQGILFARERRRAGDAEATIAAQAMAHLPTIVEGLKAARPSSISSFGRYVFLHRALAAALAQDLCRP